MTFVRELSQNPVFLREAGFAFTRRVLGFSPGLVKMVAVLGLLVFLAGVGIQQSSAWRTSLFAMAIFALVLLPILAVVVMISSPRGIRMRGGIASTALLMLSPITARSVAIGMLLGQGFAVIIAGACYWVLGAILLFASDPNSSFLVESELRVSVVLLFGGPLLVQFFVDGFKAGLRAQGFAFYAFVEYLKSLGTYSIYLVIASTLITKIFEDRDSAFYQLSESQGVFIVGGGALFFSLLRSYFCWRDFERTSSALASACEAYWEGGDAS